MAAFQRFVDRVSTDMAPDEVFQELCDLRSDFAIRHAFDGFGISYEDALEIIRNADNLTPEESAKRDILVAAVDNLVDFATAEEYHAISEVSEVLEDLDEGEPGDEEEDEDLDAEEREEAILAICSKYNQRYANVENHDIEYAMIVAAALVGMKETTTLMYMTMGDERVRPWHLQYEGYTAPKSSFPAWLVPPIEHQCRCYLVEDTQTTEAKVDVSAAIVAPEPPFWFNPTFKECVAFGGRIFSDEHPYFTIDDSHKEKLVEIANRIKNKYFNA